jgi:hypothetical protein
MANQNPEPIQSQVKLDATVGQAPFVEAFDSAALRPTLLGQMGSTIAQTAANSLATKMGYDEGMNPHGDLLPPLTEADKHYAQSYMAQSKNVLSLQLNRMLSDAQTQLSKAYKLTPQMIEDFKQQIGSGTAEILQNAPTGIKQQLGAQYANAIIGTTGALNRRMIAQNKEDAISNMKANDKNTDSAIIDNAITGSFDLAEKLYKEKIEQNKRQRETGMMTPLEEQTSNLAAKISFFTGVSNFKATEARNKKGDALAKYLTSLSDIKNKPADLSVSEWNTVGNNTLSYMRHLDALQQTDKNLILSELNEKLAKGDLVEQDILTAYQSPSFNKTDLNELLTKLYNKQTRGSSRQEKINFLIDNFSSAQAHGEADPKIVNDSYRTLVQAVRQKNPNMLPMEAESSIAAISGGPIPAFLKTVANLSKSNNLDDVVAASNAYHRVQGVSPQNVMGLPEEAYNFINAFDSFRQVNPGDPAMALAQTRNALAAKTPDEKKAIQETWNEVYRKNYSTPEKRSSLARKMLGVNTLFNSTAVQNKAVTDDHITNLLEKFTLLTGGDVETAKDMTQKAVDNVYGDTWVNGRHEKAYLSVEKIANPGNPEGTTYFVQKDIANQLQKSFKMFKDAYDAGNSDFYYRLKNPAKYDMKSLKTPNEQKKVNESELRFIETRLGEISKQPYFEGMKLDPEVSALQRRRSEIILQNRKIEKGFDTISTEHGPIEIEKVWRGQGKKEGIIQTLNAAIIPETNTTLSFDNAQPILGNYFIKLITKNGGIENLDSIQGYKMAPVYYSPNVAQIRQDYAAFHNRFGNQPSFDDELDKYLAAKGLK